MILFDSLGAENQPSQLTELVLHVIHLPVNLSKN